VLTGSVSGMLSSTLGTILIVTFCGSRGHRVWTFVLVAAVLVLALTLGDVVLPEVFRERVFDPLSQAQLSRAGTFANRSLLIREALEMSRSTLFIGFGADQYRHVSIYHTPVHNQFLLTLTEGGILAMSGLIGLFLSGAFLVWSAATRAAAYKTAAVTLVVLFVYFFAFNMFPAVYGRFWAVPLALALALSAARLRPGDAVEQRRPVPLSRIGTRERLP